MEMTKEEKYWQDIFDEIGREEYMLMLQYGFDNFFY